MTYNIYLDSSIFDVLLSTHDSCKKVTQLFLTETKNRDNYRAYISTFTLFELSLRLKEDEFLKVLKIIRTYDLRCINVKAERDIDLLFKTFKEKGFLPEKLQFDYYHLAVAAFLALKQYISWDVKHHANLNSFYKIILTMRGGGYYPDLEFHTPEYIIGLRGNDDIESTLSEAAEGKLTCYQALEGFDTNEKWAFQKQLISEFTSYQLKESGINFIDLPGDPPFSARMILPDYEERDLSAQVTMYSNEEQLKDFPLLSLPHEITGEWTGFKLIKLDITEGQEVLAGKIKERNLFTRLDRYDDTFIQKRQERNFILLNWLITQIRSILNDNSKAYHYKAEDVSEADSTKLDNGLAASLSASGQLYTIKKEAIKLVNKLTNKHWRMYQSLTLSKAWGEWSDYDIYDTFCNDTHFIFNNDGSEVWLVFIQIYIP
ncbi:MAG: hypothetical protein Roseis2KO_50300 [Roseivirga sp.]